MGKLSNFFQDCLNAGVFNPNEMQMIRVVAKLPPLNHLHDWLLRWLLAGLLRYSCRHRCFLYSYTMRVITILGTITAALKAALNITACHFADFADVQALNAALVIDMGIVFLLHNFANMKSLNTVIVLNALVGAIILRMWGRCVRLVLSQLRWLGSNFIVSGARQHGVCSPSLMWNSKYAGREGSIKVPSYWKTGLGLRLKDVNRKPARQTGDEEFEIGGREALMKNATGLHYGKRRIWCCWRWTHTRN